MEIFILGGAVVIAAIALVVGVLLCLDALLAKWKMWNN